MSDEKMERKYFVDLMIKEYKYSRDKATMIVDDMFELMHNFINDSIDVIHREHKLPLKLATGFIEGALKGILMGLASQEANTPYPTTKQ